MIPVHAYYLIAQNQLDEALRYLKLLENLSLVEIDIMRLFIVKDTIDEIDKIKNITVCDDRLKLAQNTIILYFYMQKKKYFEFDNLNNETIKLIDLLEQKENMEDDWLITKDIWKAYYYDVIGTHQKISGNINNSINMFKIAFDIREKIPNKIYFALSLNLIADVYQLIGEYNSANISLNNALNFAKENNGERLIPMIKLNLGISSYYIGNSHQGLSYLTKALSRIDQECNPSLYSLGFFYSILCLLDLKQFTQAEHLLKLLNNHQLSNNSKEIIYHYKLADALFSKSKAGFIHRAKAMKILNELQVKSMVDIIDINLSRLTMINLADILLEEYSIFSNINAYRELYEIIQRLYKLAKKQNYSIMIQVLIFQSQFALVEGKIDMMDDFLEKAEKLARLHNVEKYIRKINEIKEKAETEINKWHKIINYEKNSVELKNKLLNYLTDIGPIVGSGK